MIQDFINALASTNEKYWFYLDTKTMTVVKNRSMVDDMDVVYLAHAYPERFLPLPKKKQIHTYAIMEEYVATAPRLKDKEREKLRAALDGAGPFRRFRDEIKRQKLEDDWLRYRDARFERMAREWCAEHGIGSSVLGSASSISSEERTDARQIMTEATTTIAKTGESSLAVALIEAIRLLFHMLDDENSERALDELKKALLSTRR